MKIRYASYILKKILNKNHSKINKNTAIIGCVMINAIICAKNPINIR